MHDISRGFLDLLDAVQEERKEASGVTQSTRKSVSRLFDSLAEYLVGHAVRIEERSRYGRLTWLKNDAFKEQHFDGFFLFPPEKVSALGLFYSLLTSDEPSQRRRRRTRSTQKRSLLP